MKYCTNCGSPLAEGMNFCGNCGVPVGGQAAEAERVYEPPY